MAEYKHGTMDVRSQQKTFDGFVKMAKWTIITVICVLIFTALANA